MKIRMRKTSVEAFHSLVNKESQMYRIFQYVEEHEPVSITEISAGLNMEKSTVSARINALVNGKKDKEGNWIQEPSVEEAGRWKDEISGVRTIHWQVARTEPQRVLFDLKTWSDM